MLEHFLGVRLDPPDVNNLRPEEVNMSRATLVLPAVLISVLAVGSVASATDGNDQGNGVRAWAQVDPDGGSGSPVLVKSKNFVAVSSPEAGVYCLRARAGINLVNSAPVASQEVNLSTALGLVTVRRAGVDTALCRLDEAQVTTWDPSTPSTPTAIGGVAFDIVVP